MIFIGDGRGCGPAVGDYLPASRNLRINSGANIVDVFFNNSIGKPQAPQGRGMTLKYGSRKLRASVKSLDFLPVTP
jgi:hypothetical protein